MAVRSSGLVSLPEDMPMPSLLQLDLEDCMQLSRLPEQGLTGLTGLTSLQMKGCADCALCASG